MVKCEQSNNRTNVHEEQDLKKDLHILLHKEIKETVAILAVKEDCSISELISRAIQAYKIFLSGKEVDGKDTDEAVELTENSSNLKKEKKDGKKKVRKRD